MISQDRKQHIWAVAEFLKKYALSQKMSQKEIEDLYTLGLLHDIGYEFLEEKDYEKHEIYGGKLLKQQGYKYWKEVYYHGDPEVSYNSDYLTILNQADMQIDKYGNDVGYDNRLDDIKNRYGKESEVYNKCAKLIEKLKENSI